MKKEHWICGGAGCEAPLFRRSFWLDRTERFQSARLEICGLGYFLFYINGKRISDQELMPAMTDYASVLGCETTYPVWEERSAHRCRYLSFDLLPYLKAGENVLAVRLGNGWYHQTERIAEGKFVFGLPKLWFELTLTDADGRQEWIESDRQTLWHPGGLLKNNLFLGEVRDLRKEPEGWQYPGADLSGWKPAQPVHAPETLLEEQTCPPDRVIRKLYPILIGEYDGRKMVPLAWAKIYGDDSLLVQGYDAILRWFDYMDAHSEKGLVVREEEGGWCLGDWCFPASEEKEQLPEAFINTFYYLHGLQEMMQISEKMNNKLSIRFAEREKNVKNAFLDAYFDPETGDFCEGRAAGNAYGLALGLGDKRTKKHLVEKYEALGRFDTGIFGTSMLLEQLFSIGAAARCQSCAAGRYCTASTGIEAAQRRTAAASRARVRTAFFLRNPSQQPAAADLGKGQYPDAGWNPFGELGASGKRGKAGGVEPCARRRGQGAYNVIWQLGVSHCIKERYYTRKNNMIETILEEIRGLNLPLFWLTESEHGKRTTWSFVPDNPCNDIYSVTKVFTVTALGFLYDQGLWKPDDKICDLFRKKLPERYDPQWEEVTLDHVIRHRIGVTEDFLDIDNYDMTQFGSEDFLKLAFERPVPARPGVDYQYSDGAYYLLSRVVTELSGEKLDDFLRPRLLMPLHVREAAFSKCPMGYPIGATGMYVRTEDMAKLGEVYQNGGTFEGKRLLSKEWVEIVFEREYELAKMENGGHCKGGMNGQMLYLSPHGRVIAWQSYDPEGKGNTLMELILKNE